MGRSSKASSRLQVQAEEDKEEKEEDQEEEDKEQGKEDKENKKAMKTATTQQLSKENLAEWPRPSHDS